MSRPSTKATVAVLGRLYDTRSGPAAADLLACAHDPGLGLARSVCLRDVVVALERYYDDLPPSTDVVTFLKREFGGEI